MAKKGIKLDERGFRKFGFRDKIAYASGDFGCNMSFALAGTFFLMFYTQYMQIDAAHFATILLGLKVWDAINDPIMGTLLDNAKPGKRSGNKFTRFIIGGGIGLVLAACLCFFPMPEIIPNAAYWVKIIVCVLGYLCWDLCYTIVNVPYGTMNAVITDKPDERASLSVWRSVGAMLANIPVMVLLPFICYAGGDSGNANAFLGERMIWVALVMGIIGLFCFIYYAKNTVIRVEPKQTEQVKVNYFKAIGAFLKNRAAIGITLTAIFQLICMMGSAAAVTVLFQSYFKNAQFSGIIQLIAYLPMILLMPFISKAVKKFGKKEVSAYTMILGLVAAVLMLVLPITPDMNGLLIYLVLNAIMGISYAASGIVGWAMVSDAIDYNEYKFGARNEGTVYATYSMGRKIAQGIGPSVVLYLMVAIGYDEKLGANQLAATAEGMRYLVPAIFLVGMIGMFVSLMFIYNLDKKTLNDIQVALGRTGVPVTAEGVTVADEITIAEVIGAAEIVGDTADDSTEFAADTAAAETDETE